MPQESGQRKHDYQENQKYYGWAPFGQHAPTLCSEQAPMIGGKALLPKQKCCVAVAAQALLVYASASFSERWMSGLSRTPGKRV